MLAFIKRVRRMHFAALADFLFYHSVVIDDHLDIYVRMPPVQVQVIDTSADCVRVGSRTVRDKWSGVFHRIRWGSSSR